MTGFMLDTDISSYIIRRRPAALAEKFQKHADSLCVSVMTAAELRFGAEKAVVPNSPNWWKDSWSVSRFSIGQTVFVLTTHEFGLLWSKPVSQLATWIC